MQNISYKILEQEPHQICSLTYIKNYLRVTHDHDDELIANLIHAAIENAELVTGLTLAIKKIELSIVNIRDKIILKYIPFLKLEHISINGHNAQQISNLEELCDINMQDNIITFHGKLYNKDLKIIYKAGYLDGKIPPSMLQGILLHIGAMYDYGELNAASTNEIRNLYMPYRKLRV